MRRAMPPPLIALPLLAALAACGAPERLSRIGRAPDFAPLSNPANDPNLRNVVMPTPAPQEPPLAANSLWRPGSRTFLRDQRAQQVGDLVTVLVSIADEAELQNRTDRSRNNSEQMGVPRVMGLEASYFTIFPSIFNPSSMVEGTSTTSSVGGGQIRRNEVITLRVAATVTQVLPNGNLVVGGRQQVRVNQEMRDLTLAGILRPSDIASDNTIRHDRLAEARIAYGGRGTVSDVQAPRYGQQLLEAILPF